jgi:phosphogluconate dehydratase
VNHFHAAGGLQYMIGELIEAGLLHEEVRTVAGDGLRRYTQEPKLVNGAVTWGDGAARPSTTRSCARPPRSSRPAASSASPATSAPAS